MRYDNYCSIGHRTISVEYNIDSALTCHSPVAPPVGFAAIIVTHPNIQIRAIQSILVIFPVYMGEYRGVLADRWEGSGDTPSGIRTHCDIT